MLLQVYKVSKMFAATPILTEISMQLEARERVGLIGVNGAGKTTMLKLIAGQMTPDAGQVMFAKGTTIGYLEQMHGFNERNSIWQEMLSVFAAVVELQEQLRELEQQLSNPALLHDAERYEALTTQYGEWSEQFRQLDGYAYETKIRSILHGMGFANMSPDTAVGSLSGGQKTRLALAKLLLRQPDLLILDEPTNHLDIATLEWLEQYLRSYPGALLIVSHDRFFLDAVVNVVYELERKQARRYAGNYSFYMQAKAAIYEQQMKEYERQQADIARLEDFVQRNIVRASTTKRAQSRRRTLEKMERLDRPLGDLKKAHFAFEVERRTGKEVLKVEGLRFAFAEQPPLFEQLQLMMTRGESIALLGANGVGKSSLLKVLVGKWTPQSGSIQWGAGVRIGYFEQEQRALNPQKTVLDELWDAFPQLEEVRIRTVLGHFLFSGEDAFKKIASLSGGEKARVALAKLMLDRPNVLILDEPTNHLDVHSKEILEEALFDFEGTLLFISHDRYFINRLAEKIIELTPSGLQVYDGDYDEYRTKLQAQIEAERRLASEMEGDKKTAGAAADQLQQAKQVKRDERALKRRIEQTESEIAALETEIAECEQSLLDPAQQQNYLFLQEVSETIARLKAQLSDKYEQWQMLMES